MLDKLSRLFDLIVAISKLPVARLEFRLELDPDNVEKFYEYFTMRHPRYKIFQNKALGAALVDLAKFQTRAEYMETIKGRNSAEHHARRARNKGYRVVEINKNDYVDQLHEINNSVGVRQGRPMDAAYRENRPTTPPTRALRASLGNVGKEIAPYGAGDAASRITQRLATDLN